MTAIPSRLITGISEIVGPDNLTRRVEDLHCYSYDGTARPHLPGLVVFPQSAAQISEIMKLASTHRIPVVPRGGGTGMTGGIVPVAGGIVMPMTKLDAIVEIDTDNQVGIVEPGVITAEFQNAVRKKGLFYPVDPASLKYCSIGGNAAECAGGYAGRARAALQAGCDTVLVCNNPDGALEVLQSLKDYHDPVAQSRMVRLHGRPSRTLEQLREDPRWHRAVELAGKLTAESNLTLNLDLPT